MDGQLDIKLDADMPISFAQDWEYLMRREMQEIVPGLFLGPYASATRSQREYLLSQGITDIICVRHESEKNFLKEGMPDTFRYMTISIGDSPAETIIPYFAEVTRFINYVRKTLGGKVLVHGNAGISRSAALVVAYVMEERLLTARQALRFVQSKRFCVFPNEGFRRQLYEYEPILVAKVNASLRGLTQGENKSKRSFEDMDTRGDSEGQ